MFASVIMEKYSISLMKKVALMIPLGYLLIEVLIKSNKKNYVEFFLIVQKINSTFAKYINIHL